MTLEQALTLVTTKHKEEKRDIYEILDDVRTELSPFQFQLLLNDLILQRVFNEGIYMQESGLSTDDSLG